MASCSDDKTVRLWRCAFSGRQPEFKLESALTGYHSRPVFSVDWSPKGLLVTADGSNAIKVFAQDAEVLDGANGAEMDVDGAESASDRSIASWRLAVDCAAAHSLDVNCVRWHPKQPDLLASAGDDGLVKIWRVEHT